MSAKMIFVRRPKWLIIASNIGHNSLVRLRSRHGKVGTTHGSTHLTWRVSESVRYIRKVISDYQAYGSITPDQLQNARVLEVGPGDNLGVALLLIASGAAQVVCVDKFASAKDPHKELAIYKELRRDLTEEQKRRFDNAVELGSILRINEERVSYVSGMGLEEAGRFFEPASFELIVSRAVLMEIYEPSRALEVMYHLLRRGGKMVHKVAPLNDYRMFRANGYHLLEFLTVPDFLYEQMVASSGKPNRKLRDYYQKQLDRVGFQGKCQIVKLLGSAKEFPPGLSMIPYETEEYRQAATLVKEIKPRLARQFRGLSDDELMIEDMFIVAVKPGER